MYGRFNAAVDLDYLFKGLHLEERLCELDSFGARIAVFEAIFRQKFAAVEDNVRYQVVQNGLSLFQKGISKGQDLQAYSRQLAVSYPNINATPLTDYKNDILKGQLISRPLAEKYGQDYEYFRYPFLRTGNTKAYQQEIWRFLKENGYKVAPVTMDNDEYIYAYVYLKLMEKGEKEKPDPSAEVMRLFAALR